LRTGPPGLVGTELEWLVVSVTDPTASVPIPVLRDLLDAAGPPPSGSRVTYEPGGQLELSSPAFPGASACWQALADDAEHVRRPLEAAGLRLLPTAIDPFRTPARQLVHPRYDAMEAYFATAGGESAEVGPVMMTSTAALQVNLDIGTDQDDAARRWRLLHTVGPTGAVLASDPYYYAGAWTSDACRKAVRLVDLAQTFHLPVVHFVDIPGFLIGKKAEADGVMRFGTQALAVIRSSTVPWCSIMVRKAFGMAALTQRNGSRAFLRYAWPSARWGSLPIAGGVDAAYRAAIEAASSSSAASSKRRRGWSGWGSILATGRFAKPD